MAPRFLPLPFFLGVLDLTGPPKPPIRRTVGRLVGRVKTVDDAVVGRKAAPWAARARASIWMEAERGGSAGP